MKTERETEAAARLFTVSFTALLVGQITSILGDRLNNIAMVELVSQETGRFTRAGSTFELSKLALAMTLPSLVFGPFAGALVDRVDRKRVLILSDLIRGFAVLAIPFLRPGLPLWTVYGVIMLLYFTNIFFLPARCAIVTEMVSRSNLIRANSTLSLGATLATIIGFGAGGVVTSRAGWRFAFFADSATYFLSSAALLFIKTDALALGPRQASGISYRGALRQALGEMRKSRITWTAVVVPPLLVMAGTITYVLGVAIVEAGSQKGTMLVGLLTSLAGTGMALGCYFTGRSLRTRSRFRIAVIASAIAILFLAPIGFSHSFVVMGIAITAAGFAAGPVLVSTETAIQEEVPARRQATVFAMRDVLMKISTAAAATIAATTAAIVGMRPALVVLLCCLAIALPILLYKKR